MKVHIEGVSIGQHPLVSTCRWGVPCMPTYTEVQECPVRNAICHICKKRGHFNSQCFHRRVHTCTSTSVHSIEDVEDQDIFTSIINSKDKNSSWLVTINEQETTFKVDTGGAEVTVITESPMTQLGIQQTLQPAKRILCEPDGNKLRGIGETRVTISNNKHSTIQIVYVLKKLQH